MDVLNERPDEARGLSGCVRDDLRWLGVARSFRCEVVVGSTYVPAVK